MFSVFSSDVLLLHLNHLDLQFSDGEIVSLKNVAACILHANSCSVALTQGFVCGHICNNSNQMVF